MKSRLRSLCFFRGLHSLLLSHSHVVPSYGERCHRLPCTAGTVDDDTAPAQSRTMQQDESKLEVVLPGAADPWSGAAADISAQLLHHFLPSGPHSPALVLDRIRAAVAKHPDKVLYRWLNDAGTEVETMTFGELWARSGAIARRLVSRRVGLRPGDLAMITFPIGIAFMPAVIACLRTGVVAVSTYPPDLRRPGSEMPKYARLVKACGARVVLTTSKFRMMLRAVTAAGHALPEGIDTWVLCDSKERVEGAWLEGCDIARERNDVALIQYTSGSSGDPKGVVINHGNLAYCITVCQCGYSSCIAAAGGGSAPTLHSTVSVSWLPQYHDCTCARTRNLGVAHRAGCTHRGCAVELPQTASL